MLIMLQFVVKTVSIVVKTKMDFPMPESHYEMWLILNWLISSIKIAFDNLLSQMWIKWKQEWFMYFPNEEHISTSIRFVLYSFLLEKYICHDFSKCYLDSAFHLFLLLSIAIHTPTLSICLLCFACHALHFNQVSW